MKNFKRIDDQVEKNTKKIAALEIDVKMIEVLEKTFKDVDLKTVGISDLM